MDAKNTEQRVGCVFFSFRLTSHSPQSPFIKPELNKEQPQELGQDSLQHHAFVTPSDSHSNPLAFKKTPTTVENQLRASTQHAVIEKSREIDIYIAPVRL